MRVLNFLILIFFTFLIFVNDGIALSTSDIIAYPVPFNPNKEALNIGYKTTGPFFPSGTVKIEIYDINGDIVFTRSYTQGGTTKVVIWSGRNDKGKKVKSGLYIIKVTIEDEDGDYGQKLIRVLVAD